MPLLRFYLPSNLLSTEEKKYLSQTISEIYKLQGLPAFYVNVFFIEIPHGSQFVGGEIADDFIRICIEHIALAFPSDDSKTLYMQNLDNAICPLFESKGYRWEYHISETPRELWKVQSIVPPPHLSVAERTWARENRASQY